MLFTGQRLDGTGLYYYNARYYDLTIGRFISPDTVIQSLANPQTLNRYVYSLNNPLKYVDPSGHVVLINGVNAEDIYNAMESGNYDVLLGISNQFLGTGSTADENYALLTAYGIVRSFDPNMIIGLETSSKIVEISFGETGDAGGSCLPTNYAQAAAMASAGNGCNINWDITLVSSTSSNGLASLLGHELFHANDPWLSDSIQEELRAYQYGDQIAAYLHSDYSSGFSDLNPNSKECLETAQRRMLVDSMPDFYTTLPLYSVNNRFADLYWAIREGLDSLF
jgi:RHS repeat-associated protein